MEKKIEFVGNWSLDVIASGKQALDICCELALGSSAMQAVAFRDYPAIKDIRVRTLVILWHCCNDATPFPFTLNAERLSSVLDGWLCSLTPEDRGPAPDIDGSVRANAFRIFTTDKIINLSFSSYAIFAIQPVWAEYHK